MREVLSSKIHRAWVTDANPDYVGSILIDKDLMDRVNLWDFEKVLVCDITKGNRCRRARLRRYRRAESGRPS
jgi:aspartate 1-decarboxylase